MGFREGCHGFTARTCIYAKVHAFPRGHIEEPQCGGSICEEEGPTELVEVHTLHSVPRLSLCTRLESSPPWGLPSSLGFWPSLGREEAERNATGY